MCSSQEGEGDEGKGCVVGGHKGGSRYWGKKRTDDLSYGGRYDERKFPMPLKRILRRARREKRPPFPTQREEEKSTRARRSAYSVNGRKKSYTRAQ